MSTFDVQKAVLADGAPFPEPTKVISSSSQMTTQMTQKIHHARSATDDERLAQLDIKQELERSFSLPTLAALCLCLMATWEALSTVLAQALLSGGAPCLFYNYIASFLCSLAVAASLAEIASIYPTAGGQYYWVAILAPARSRKALAWYTGWISVGGQIVFTASAAFAAGLQAQALIILGDDTYQPTRWQGMLFYWAIIAIALVVNIWSSKMLTMTNLVSGILHVAGFIAIFVVLLALAPKNTAAYVFTQVTNETGWSSGAVAWLVGLISAVYPFLGYDAACHLSEEVPHASRNVPLAMVGSVLMNGLMGLAYCIVLLYSTGGATDSLATLLASPTGSLGFPFMQIYLDVTQSRAGAIVMALVPVLIATAASVAGLTSTSRTLYSFVRDRAVPCSRYLSHVDERAHVPARSAVLVALLQGLLGFIYLGSVTAFNAVLSMAIIGLYLSYLLPIAVMLLCGRPGLSVTEYGPFRLGKPLGILLNLVGIAWMVLVIIFSTFPGSMPTTASTMNYSIVVMAGWVFFGTIYYVFWGRHTFQVPHLVVSNSNNNDKNNNNSQVLSGVPVAVPYPDRKSEV